MTLLDKLRGISEPVITVHDGRFHADELLAIAVIKTALPDRTIRINRSRDPFAWERSDLVLDVGGARNSFDHHRPDNPKHPNGVPYATCGLVLDAIEEDVKLRKQLYIDLFYTVEWDDNTAPGEITSPNWELKPNLLAWVPQFQPLREEAPSEYEMREYFDRALEMVTLIYKRVRKNAQLKLKNREVADKATFVVKDGFLIVPNAKTPYQRYMFEHPEITGAIVPEPNGRGYTIKIWREGPRDPVLRGWWPSTWCGLADFELEQVARVRGLIYCNNNGSVVKCRDFKAAEQALRWVSRG